MWKCYVNNNDDNNYDGQRTNWDQWRTLKLSARLALLTFFVLILILYTSNILFKFICRWCLRGKSLTKLIFVEFSCTCTSCNKCIVWCNLMLSNIFEQNSEYIVYFLERWSPQKYNRKSLDFLDDCKILIREKSSSISDIMKKLYFDIKK